MSESGGAQPVRVLVVDDEEAIGRMICRTNIDHEVYAFSSTTSARDAVDRIAAGNVDILLTDIDMPEMDGYALMTETARLDPYLPVIALTAHGDDPAVEIRCLQNGARYFLSKPFDNDAVLAAIDAVYRHAEAERNQAGMLRNISKSRDLLQSILENTTDVVLVKDRDLRYVLMNQVGLDFIGLSAEELKGKTDADLYPEAVAAKLREADLRVLEQGELIETTAVVEARDDKRVYSVKKFPLRDNRGGIWAVCGISRDVTERTRFEDALRESEKMLSSVFSTTPVGICVTDENGAFVQVNNTYCSIYGYTEDELLGRRFDCVLTEKDREWGRRMYDSFITGPETEEIPSEWRVQRKDGSLIDVWVTASRLDHDDGRRFKVTTVRDITEEKRLRLEREMYHEAFSNAIHGIVITDPSGRILHVNKAFTEMYGYEQDEVLGQNPRILNPGKGVYRDLGIDEDEYNHRFAQMWAHLADPGIGHWEGEVVNQHKDGGLRWVRLYLSVIRDANGVVIAYAGMPVDITAMRAREDSERVEFYQALAELAEARDNETGMHLKRIGSYAGKLAANLRMPLKYVNDIQILAPLHDVGKVGIADEILLAPRRLSPEEFEIMKTHATLGYDIMRGRPALAMAAEIAHSHHEKWDGSGYPQGLAGDAIPLSARIVAVCDVYDALRSERPYKEAWPHDRAAAIIHEGRGTHFDPQMVDAFERLEDEFRRIADEMRDEEE